MAVADIGGWLERFMAEDGTVYITCRVLDLYFERFVFEIHVLS